MVVLAFFFPITVRLGKQIGISENVSFSMLGALLTFALATYLVRWQVNRHRVSLSRIEKARDQVKTAPDQSQSYFIDGEHLGMLLLKLDRRREAAEVIDWYARVGEAKESEILGLREALSQAERRQRRAQGREA